MRNVIKAVSGWRIVLVVFALLSVVTLPSEADPVLERRDLPSEAEAVSIGDYYAGGIVFYVDQSGEHGLVAAERDLPGTYPWLEARKACLGYEVNGYSGWYMPSRWELNELYKHKDVVGGFGANYYWSSSEYDAAYAWYQYFNYGNQNTNPKDYVYYRVRPVRAF